MDSAKPMIFKGSCSKVLVSEHTFYVGSKKVISGPHACEVGTLLTAPSAPLI